MLLDSSNALNDLWDFRIVAFSKSVASHALLILKIARMAEKRVVVSPSLIRKPPLHEMDKDYHSKLKE